MVICYAVPVRVRRVPVSQGFVEGRYVLQEAIHVGDCADAPRIEGVSIGVPKLWILWIL